MKLLCLHSDYIKVKPTKKALKSAEDIEKESLESKESLVVFTAVEKNDKDNPEAVVDNGIEEIKKVYDQVKAKEILLYPYVHLTKNPGSSSLAQKILSDLSRKLSKKHEVKKAPFGWYKAFEISVKGHPLAELSREISAEEKKPAKERKEETKFSRFILLDKDGKEHEISKDNWKQNKILNKKSREYKNLKSLVECELGKPKSKKKPPHIDLMRKLELVDYCEASDAGHFKWHPKGVLIKELMLDYQNKLSRDYGAFKIQNPILYKFDDERIRKLIGEFQEKIYTWDDNGKTLVLRPASDPGQFPYVQSLTFSYKQLPIKQYEESLSFRKEQSGELTGLRRVRSFLMTDMHTFTADEKQGKEEFEELSFICKDIMDSVISKGDWILEWEGTEDYWEDNKDWIKGLTKKLGKPALVMLSKKRSHYYSMKMDFEAIHPSGIETQVSTVQMDLVNGKRFDITYKGEDNKQHPCVILHCSTFGSIERTLTFMLEDALRDEDKNPTLPLWLSPTQVRLCPVNDSFVSYCKELSKKMEEENIRVDIDDRDESVQKKVRAGEVEWVPMIIVIGDREKESNKLPVRFRETGNVKKMTLKELTKLIKNKTKNYPFRPLPLPKLLTQRPKFVG